MFTFKSVVRQANKQHLMYSIKTNKMQFSLLQNRSLFILSFQTTDFNFDSLLVFLFRKIKSRLFVVWCVIQQRERWKEHLVDSGFTWFVLFGFLNFISVTISKLWKLIVFLLHEWIWYVSFFFDVFPLIPNIQQSVEWIITNSCWCLQRCEICGQKGGCVQCSERRCYVAYHATCAQKNLKRYVMKITENKKTQQMSYISFCQRHSVVCMKFQFFHKVQSWIQTTLSVVFHS